MQSPTADISPATVGVQSIEQPAQEQRSTDVRLARDAQVLHPQTGSGAAALSGDWNICGVRIPESWTANATYGAGLVMSCAGIVTSSMKSHAPAGLQRVSYGLCVAGSALKVREAALSVARFTHNTAPTLPKMPDRWKNTANGLLTGGLTLTLSGLGLTGLQPKSFTPMTLAVAGSQFVLVGTVLKVRDGMIEAAHVARDPGVASAHVENVFGFPVNTLENVSTAIGVTLAAIGFGIGTGNPTFGLQSYVPTVLEVSGTTFMVLGFVPKVRDAAVAIARVLNAPQPLHPIQAPHREAA